MRALCPRSADAATPEEAHLLSHRRQRRWRSSSSAASERTRCPGRNLVPNLEPSRCAIRFAFRRQYPELVVNYIEYLQVEPTTAEPLYFNEQNARQMVAVAKARWKIENETFHTLKKQGYHLEHNHGHGTKYLATNFAILTFVAFLQSTQSPNASMAPFKKHWKSVNLRGLYGKKSDRSLTFYPLRQ